MSEASINDVVARRGLMLVLSSPSGAGKSTLARDLLAKDEAITLSVSVTTRPPREGEVDGRDYFFISQDKFDEMRDGGELLEWAEVFGNSYATPRAAVEGALAEGQDVLFDIDWQGTQQLASAMADDLVRVFILPPSASALSERLINRAQDSSTVVAKRMAEAAKEISHWPEYEYVIINDDLEEAKASLTAILAAERLKRKRRTGLVAFTRTLVDNL